MDIWSSASCLLDVKKFLKVDLLFFSAKDGNLCSLDFLSDILNLLDFLNE